jgi:hypothetical protein
MSEEGYQLTGSQHDAVGQLIAAGGVTVRQDPTQNRKTGYLPPIRVIALTDRTYDSTTSEQLPCFVYDRSRTVYCVEQVGDRLSGYFALIVNGERYTVECRRTSLADLALPCRATVFPGLWEFDFGPLSTGSASRIEVSA